MKSLVFWILVGLSVFAITLFVIADFEGDATYNKLQKCETELLIYQEINNELIKRVK